MDTYKLRMKIGTAEFEAEGSEETVRQQFEEFKALLDHPAHTSAGSSAPKENGGAQTEAPATKLKSPDVTGLDRLFRRRVVARCDSRQARVVTRAADEDYLMRMVGRRRTHAADVLRAVSEHVLFECSEQPRSGLHGNYAPLLSDMPCR